MSITWNWVVFALYTIGMIMLGYYGYKRTKDSSDFYVAGRSFGLKIAVPLFAASFISSVSIVGYTGFAYGYGYSMLAMYGLGCAGGWIALQIFAPRLYNIKCKWATTPDLFCERYYDEKFMRPFMGIFNILYMIVYVTMGIMGIGTILEVFLGIQYTVAVILIMAIILIYTTFGGMFSVGWTNAAQFIFLFVAVVLAAILAVNMAGGITSLNNATFAIEGGITNLTKGAMHSFTAGGLVPLSRILGLALGIALICPASVYYQRIFFSVKSKKVAGSFIGIGALFLIVAYICIALIGMSARVLLPTLESVEHAFPSLVMMLPILLGSIIVVGIIAAIQSTVDNQLLSAGSMITNDIYNKLLKKDASDNEIVRASRWLTLVAGLFVIVIALIRPGLVIDLYNFVMVLVPTVLFPPLVLGLYWKRTTREAGIFGAIFGLVAGLGWMYLGPKSIPATLVIVPLSIILMAIISLRTSEPPQEVVDKFF